MDQAPAILDLTTLLEAFGDINDELLATLSWFLEAIAPQLEDIAEKLGRGDLAGASDVAHAAKGVANTTGALRLGRLCGEIDTALRRGDAELAGRTLPALSPALADVSDAIYRLIGSRSEVL